MAIEKSSDLIGNRTRDLLTCSSASTNHSFKTLKQMLHIFTAGLTVLRTFLNVAEDLLHCLGGAFREAGVRHVAHPQEGRWERGQTETNIKLTVSFSGDVTILEFDTAYNSLYSCRLPLASSNSMELLFYILISYLIS
jgi:hypothetical protein